MYLAEEMSEGERGKEAVHFLDFPAWPHQQQQQQQRSRALKRSLIVVPWWNLDSNCGNELQLPGRY